MLKIITFKMLKCFSNSKLSTREECIKITAFEKINGAFKKKIKIVPSIIWFKKWLILQVLQIAEYCHITENSRGNGILVFGSQVIASFNSVTDKIIFV